MGVSHNHQTVVRGDGDSLLSVTGSADIEGGRSQIAGLHRLGKVGHVDGVGHRCGQGEGRDAEGEGNGCVGGAGAGDWALNLQGCDFGVEAGEFGRGTHSRHWFSWL